MNLSLKIDEVKSIDASDFRQHYLKTRKPLLIKGMANQTEAGTTWSVNYFKSALGHVEVDLYDNRNVNGPAAAFTRPDLRMKLGEYLDVLARNEPGTFRIFLFDLFKRNPALKKEFPCPAMFKGALDGIAHMFFGGKDTTIRMHYDLDMSNALHTHFGGKKRVVLIGPEYSQHLYRLPFSTYSLVDIDRPDYKKYPALLSVKGYEVILEHGDTLFMPSGYWHYMTYVDAGFSVSYRKLAGGLGAKLRGAANLALWMPLDKMINALLGPAWLDTKKRMAQKRAYHAIEREYDRSTPAFIRETQDITFV